MKETYPSKLYSASKIAPLWMNGDRHEDLMSELADERRFISFSGQHFSGLHVNRFFASSIPLVRLGSWLSASNTPEAKYTMYQFAAANPERQILLIDMPSHGSSDNLSAKQWAETVRFQKVSEIGKAQAEAVRSHIPSATEIIVVGDSLGGRVAPDFARHAGQLGLNPILIAGFDIAGIDKRRSLRMAEAFFIAEKKRQHRYHEGPQNMALDEAYDHQFVPMLPRYGMSNVKYNPMAVYKKNPLLSLFFLARSPIASNTAFQSIEAVLDYNDQVIASFVSGGLSKVCRWQHIQEDIQSLKDKYNKRFTWDVWPNDSHSMNIAPQQPRFAQLTRNMIDNVLN
ncbi:MAG TPA: alpha/beta hydrolase [Candidatus Saccharimonadales bacterium]|nr:alpha/beta hydrolase [Candidatus Saccharimonadales bacterium]